jgi:hypothetical protein
MTYSRPWMFFGLALMIAGAILLCRQNGDRSLAQQPREPNEQEKVRQKSPAATKPDAKPAATKPDAKKLDAKKPDAKKPATPKWKNLFDGKTLTGWKAPNFGGQGKVYVKDGTIVMQRGSYMTGVTWTGKVLRNNYELTLEGMRLDGSDFFCTTTFPVGDEPCMLVVGGRGGQLIGLSNVDYQDASENATSSTMEFKDKRWYRVRIRVTDAAIEAWIGDQQVVKQPRKDHTFGIRMEVELCRPLGISTWDTTGAVRNIRLRELDAKKPQ